MARGALGLPEDRGLGPLGKAALALEVVSTYARARRLLRRTDLAHAVGALRNESAVQRPPGVDERVLGLRLGRATGLVLTALPADSRCLMRSLVLTGMLARRGIVSRLVVAVHPRGVLAAHAWVEHDGRPLLEPSHSPFERLLEL